MSARNKTVSLKDPLENLLGYQLRRATFAMSSALVGAFAGLGLNLTEATLIRFVHANAGCTQADIGRALTIQRANLVPIINGLMVKGLIERTAADGRSHALYLTGQGAELQRKIVKLGLEHEQYFFGDIPEETRQILLQVFQLLRSKGEKPDESGPVGTSPRERAAVHKKRRA